MASERARRVAPWILLAVCLAGAKVVRAQSLPALPTLEEVVLGGGSALQLSTVWTSVALHHPTVDMANARIDAASAAVQSAQGGFDPMLAATGYAAPAGYYNYARADVSLTQPTSLWGASLVAGWRIGRGVEGDIPDYYRFHETLDAGEVRAGFTIPVWRDGPIDARRAGVTRGEHNERATVLERDARVLRLQLAGAEAYIRWVAAGMKLRIAQDLWRLAQARDEQLAQRVAAGAISHFERVDNRRAILERHQAVIAARRSFERAALSLSLFLRDVRGTPRTPSPEELPQRIEADATSSPDEDAWVARALSQRPELARFGSLRARLEVDVDLAENQVGPRLDVSVMGSADIGRRAENPVVQQQLGKPVLETWLQFSLPLGMRDARGRASAARAELRAILAEQQLTEDQIRMEVHDACSAVRAAVDALAVAEQSVVAAEEVADGERRRLQEGASTLLWVNLRETTAAQASAVRVDALADLAYANAWLRAAAGVAR